MPMLPLSPLDADVSRRFAEISLPLMPFSYAIYLYIIFRCRCFRFDYFLPISSSISSADDTLLLSR